MATKTTPLSRLESLGYTLERRRDADTAFTIHFAQCRTSRLPVVLKELPATSPSRVSLCLREASVMEALSHRHIVALYHQVVLEKRLFLVMQRALGGDLHDFITSSPRGRLSLADSKRIFAQLILALEHMHNNNIVHADVKPDNIFLDHEYNVLLGDFGLSERFHPGSRSLSAISGTLHYSAPETFIGTPVCGPELDVWSAGVVLYVMMRGRFPFWGSTPRDTSHIIMFSEPHWPEWFPDDSIDLLKRMLVKNPSRRSSIHEIRNHPFIQSEIQYWEQELSPASEWAEAA